MKMENENKEKLSPPFVNLTHMTITVTVSFDVTDVWQCVISL